MRQIGDSPALLVPVKSPDVARLEPPPHSPGHYGRLDIGGRQPLRAFRAAGLRSAKTAPPLTRLPSYGG
ncbi:MAG: hypothetical protein N2111_08400 [Candidatus Sumerlaeaceae bacterium]|nr:hypothetical protein [Candidatus Sumerlaeaceae bacterium]